MNIDWRGLIRHYLLVVVFCCVISALITGIWWGYPFCFICIQSFGTVLSTAIWWGQPYWKELGYALCISTPIWAIIDVGRFMLVRPTDPVAWPRGVRGVLLVIAGIGLGFYFGSWLGDALFGIGDVPAPRHKLITALITIIASIAGFYFFYTRLDRAALSARISAAERDTAQARLKLLATQLEPHMLFNTLANLRALIGSDPPRAIATLDRLDNYLRVTLTGSLAHTHPLAAEFERLADYLALMQVRMGPRLRYALDLPDNLRSVPVPPLLLQPLVENSIRHGLETKVEGGQITVRARLDGGCLVIEVHDTGTGLDEAATTVNRGTGFGLTQIRQRLTSTYGETAALELASAPNSGTRATLTLPLERI